MIMSNLCAGQTLAPTIAALRKNETDTRPLPKSLTMIKISEILKEGNKITRKPAKYLSYAKHSTSYIGPIQLRKGAKSKNLMCNCLATLTKSTNAALKTW